MRFTRQDFESVLDFVRDLYDHRGLDDFAHRTMGSLLRIVSAERIVYGEFDVERQAARFSMQPSVVKEQDGTVNGALHGVLSGLETRFGNHPLYRYYLQTGDGRAQKSSQVMTKSQFQRYCESDDFAGQLGAKYQMAVFFTAGPNIVTVILLTRNQRDFSERERALLNTLYPHLVQSFRNTASLNRFCRDVDELVEMLEGPTSSVIVLTGEGSVKRWTEQAKKWIARYCRTPFPAVGDRLPDCFADWYRRQLALLAQHTLLPRRRDPLIVDKDDRQLTVQLIPDRLRDEHLLLLNEKHASASWSTLGEYGLTPRESEVLAWVAKGKTNAEVGAILQLSGRTVQKHLEHIYQKLGVETRTTATVRVLGLLRETPEAHS
jgi:DNA-binding CsgD family transcriptional regulator